MFCQYTAVVALHQQYVTHKRPDKRGTEHNIRAHHHCTTSFIGSVLISNHVAGCVFDMLPVFHPNKIASWKLRGQTFQHESVHSWRVLGKSHPLFMLQWHYFYSLFSITYT